MTQRYQLYKHIALQSVKTYNYYKALFGDLFILSVSVIYYKSRLIKLIIPFFLLTCRTPNCSINMYSIKNCSVSFIHRIMVFY